MAEVNMEMVEKVAKKIKELPISGTALTFTEGNMYPPAGDDGALDYFFATVMQDYGFWLGDERGYVKPLYGEVGGKKLKGADLLWTLSMRVYGEGGPEFFNPENLAWLSFPRFCVWLPEEFEFQDKIDRYRMAVGYGQYCIVNSVDPATMISIANHSTWPLRSFLNLSSTLPGYDQDLLLKKNLLLAMILANRPERFLKVGPEEKWPPIADYHLMRVSLRLGIVEPDPQEYELLSRRTWVSGETENSVRSAVYDAVNMVIELSGRTMSEVDFLLWSARRYCPEMEAPNCSKCVFDSVCAKRIELFQPVFRTTSY
ncbi:MAG: hypothetical protein HY505_00030 [Candidatus Yanofskybacteria bacterium]|nr:hypothetical protein [Candidatus Yanofskybacteria bacterium]